VVIGAAGRGCRRRYRGAVQKDGSVHGAWSIDTRPPRGDLLRAGGWALAAIVFGVVFIVAGVLPYDGPWWAHALVITIGLLILIGGRPSLRRLRHGVKPATLSIGPSGVEYDGPRGSALHVGWPQVRAAELRTAQLVFVTKGRRTNGAVLAGLDLHVDDAAAGERARSLRPRGRGVPGAGRRPSRIGRTGAPGVAQVRPRPLPRHSARR